MAGGRYFWLKLKRDFFKRHDITILESFPDGKEILLFYIKLLCESADHDGRLRFSDEIPYTWSMLSAVTRTDQEIVNAAIEILQELGLVEILDDATIYMKKIGDMVGSESAEAGKKREQRRRKEDEEGTSEGQTEDNDGTTEGQDGDKKGQCPDNVPTMSDRDKSIEFRDQNNIEKENKEKKPARPRFVPPTIEEVTALVRERNYHINPEAFVRYYESNGWKVGKNPMKDWRAAAAGWEAREKKDRQDAPRPQEPKAPTGAFYFENQRKQTAQETNDFAAEVEQRQREERARKRREGND